MSWQGHPHYDTYYKSFQLYKTIEASTPFIELLLAAVAAGYLLLNKRPSSRLSHVMRILFLFILSNSALVVCLLWQMLDPVE